MTIELDNHITWPRVGSIWTHHNGNNYIVESYSNIETDRQDRYPTTIIYRNLNNGHRYSRPLLDWSRSMTLVRE